MSKLILTTKGIMALFDYYGVNISVEFDNTECIIEATRKGHVRHQYRTTISNIDKRIRESYSSNVLPIIADNKLEMRTSLAIRIMYQHIVREKMIDGLIPIHIAEEHGYKVGDTSTLDVLYAVNKRDCVFIEYQLKGIIPGIWEDEQAITRNTELIGKTSSLVGRIN